MIFLSKLQASVNIVGHTIKCDREGGGSTGAASNLLQWIVVYNSTSGVGHLAGRPQLKKKMKA